MGNVADFEAWLDGKNYRLETFGIFKNSPSCALMQISSIAAFEKACADWQAIYSKELVWKQSSGVGQFTYYILGQNKGICITISDTVQSPGVVVKMNPVEEYFSQHRTQLRLFKYGTVALVPIFSVLAIGYLQNSDLTIKAALITAITGLNLYVANLKPEAYWDGVGFQVKRKR